MKEIQILRNEIKIFRNEIQAGRNKIQIGRNETQIQIFELIQPNQLLMQDATALWRFFFFSRFRS